LFPLFGENLDDSLTTALLKRLFDSSLSVNMKQCRAGIYNPTIFAWLEDLLKFLTAYCLLSQWITTRLNGGGTFAGRNGR
jgi:hypothetical protein